MGGLISQVVTFGWSCKEGITGLPRNHAPISIIMVSCYMAAICMFYVILDFYLMIWLNDKYDTICVLYRTICSILRYQFDTTQLF